jgi:peptidyl-prolyl cis-trans isomerase SurA
MGVDDVRNQMKKLWGAALVGALCTGGLASAELVDRVAAVVNDQVVALSEVEQRAAPELAQISTLPDARQRAELRTQVMKQSLDALIAERLLEVQIKELGISVSEPEVQTAMDDIRRQNGMDEATFAQALRGEGYTLESYKEFMRGQLKRMKLINLKVRSRLQISEEELRTAYNQWARLEKQEAEVHARHILVKVEPNASPEQLAQAEQKARELAAEARRPGVDFAKLAQQKSEGPSAKDGGDLGYFRRGLMLPEFDKVAFSLPEGGVSDPVRTHFGFHVIKVEERRALPVKPFEEMKAELEDKLFREQMEKYTEQYVKELRQTATVEVRI